MRPDHGRKGTNNPKGRQEAGKANANGAQQERKGRQGPARKRGPIETNKKPGTGASLGKNAQNLDNRGQLQAGNTTNRAVK